MSVKKMTSSIEKVVVSGREFTPGDINQIKKIMDQHPAITRTALSRKVCDVLHWFRPNGQRNDMTCRVALNRLENMADRVYRSALAELFEDTADMAEVIKWREIYEHMETATDRCEDVANVLEGVALKHA